MKKSHLIAQGKTSKIYLNNNKIIKRFSSTYPTLSIIHESKVQNNVAVNTNLNVVLTELISDNREITMDFISGPTLGDRMRIEKYRNGVEDLVKLQLIIHTNCNLDLPSSKSHYRAIIEQSNLDKPHKRRLVDLLDTLDTSYSLCHFDLHFLNIIFSRSEYFIIDWPNAKIGNPILDIARTFIILKQYTPRLSGKYLKLIEKNSDHKAEDVMKYIPIIALERSKELDSSSFSGILETYIMSS